jgi:hypothetical protein
VPPILTIAASQAVREYQKTLSTCLRSVTGSLNSQKAPSSDSIGSAKRNTPTLTWRWSTDFPVHGNYPSLLILHVPFSQILSVDSQCLRMAQPIQYRRFSYTIRQPLPKAFAFISRASGEPHIDLTLVLVAVRNSDSTDLVACFMLMKPVLSKSLHRLQDLLLPFIR